jgi:hypothetical protein
VPSAPGAAGVRVWEVMSRGRGPRVGRPLPEGVHVEYALNLKTAKAFELTIPPSLLGRRGSPSSGSRNRGGVMLMHYTLSRSPKSITPARASRLE